MTKNDFKTLSSMIRILINYKNVTDFTKRDLSKLLEKSRLIPTSDCILVRNIINNRDIPKLETERQMRIKSIAGRWSGTVYYINGGIDCDGVRSARSVEFKNQYIADVSIEKDHKWSDGTTNWEKCTKAEHDKFKSYKHDTFAKAAGY